MKDAARAAAEPNAAGTRAPRVFETICDQVREQLASGALKPGDKLPAERELALQCGSSRTAVREGNTITDLNPHTGSRTVRQYHLNDIISRQ